MGGVRIKNEFQRRFHVMSQKGEITIKIPYTTKKVEGIGQLIDGSITIFLIILIISLFLLLIGDYSITPKIIAFFIGILIWSLITFVGYKHAQKSDLYSKNLILISDDKIIVKEITGKTTVLEGRKLCDLKLHKFGKMFYSPPKAGLKYLTKEVYEKYHSTFGMYGFVRLGVPTKEQWEILRKEIEEFKKRNNIAGCKPKKGGKS